MNKVITAFKYTLPTLMCICLVLITLMPFSLNPYYRLPTPYIFGVIFYFGIFHPAVLNVVCVFFIGMFADMLNNSPFGLQTFFYVLMFFVANLNRRYFLTLNFADLWMAFSLVLSGTLLLYYLFFMIVSLTIPPFIPIIFQYLVLVCTYPLVSWTCGWINLKIWRH